MEKTKSLYCYFGELGLFEENIPGHTFYQVGLLDAISEKYGNVNFDFYNYMDTDGVDIGTRPTYPDGILGQVFEGFTQHLVEDYRIGYEDVLLRMSNKEYDKIFLKARFRNLSTLQKKLKDAQRFETFIKHAIACGYAPYDIVILDTDLSLSPEFLETIENLGITREIVSVTIPGIGSKFLESCLAVHENSPKPNVNSLLYYGNLSFDNYKEGHAKNPIINDIINWVEKVTLFNGDTFQLTVAAKETSELNTWINSLDRAQLIPRQNREEIWNSFTNSLVSINVSKDLYLQAGFTPARVYESIIFGVIPVSYMKGPHSAMTFETVDDFFEICKFLSECSAGDYFKILREIAKTL